MKAEEIIAIDMKTTQKILNYNGPIFLSLEKNILANMGNYLLEVRVLYCKKCKKKTSQEWVRDHTFKYWRCSECLAKQLKENGIFYPLNPSFRLAGVHKQVSKFCVGK